MEREQILQLLTEIQRSIEARKVLHDKVSRDENVDLVEEWSAIEQLDAAIARTIRKRPVT